MLIHNSSTSNGENHSTHVSPNNEVHATSTQPTKKQKYMNHRNPTIVIFSSHYLSDTPNKIKLLGYNNLCSFRGFHPVGALHNTYLCLLFFTCTGMTHTPIYLHRYDTYSIKMLWLQCCHRSGSIQFGPERQVCGVVCNSCKSGTSQNRNRPYDHVYPSQPFLIHTWLFCVTQQRLHKSSLISQLLFTSACAFLSGVKQT